MRPLAQPDSCRWARRELFPQNHGLRPGFHGRPAHQYAGLVHLIDQHGSGRPGRGFGLRHGQLGAGDGELGAGHHGGGLGAERGHLGLEGGIAVAERGARPARASAFAKASGCAKASPDKSADRTALVAAAILLFGNIIVLRGFGGEGGITLPVHAGGWRRWRQRVRVCD
ncbi:MAG: hypothetical protein KGL56_09900, partial [Alphaproteobacteria bacterium]|nr:hypothetical protein [Alphaproteobacteria bacterium]